MVSVVDGNVQRHKGAFLLVKVLLLEEACPAPNQSEGPQSPIVFNHSLHPSTFLPIARQNPVWRPPAPWAWTDAIESESCWRGSQSWCASETRGSNGGAEHQKVPTWGPGSGCTWPRSPCTSAAWYTVRQDLIRGFQRLGDRSSGLNGCNSRRPRRLDARTGQAVIFQSGTQEDLRQRVLQLGVIKPMHEVLKCLPAVLGDQFLGPFRQNIGHRETRGEASIIYIPVDVGSMCHG